MPFLTQGKTNWKYIIIVLILAVIVGGGILIWVEKQKVPSIELPKIEKPEKVGKEEPRPENETANWRTYRNEEYGFEIKYPKESSQCSFTDFDKSHQLICKQLFLPTPNQYKKYNYKINYGVGIFSKEEKDWKELIRYLEGKEKGKKIFNRVEFDYYRDDGILVGMESWAPLYYYVTESKKQNKKIIFWVVGFYRAKFCEQCYGKETKKAYEVYAAGPIENHCEKCKGDSVMKKVEQEIINQMLSTFRFLE